MSILTQIQTNLNAPKSKKNSFGNYNYRSCEDILEALKQHLTDHDCYVTLSDEIEAIGGRVYVKATATLYKSDGAVMAFTHGYAREEETKKGMDSSQITGAASSYARKYALNGLFAIDDSVDSDATNTHGKEDKPSKQSTPSPAHEKVRQDRQIDNKMNQYAEQFATQEQKQQILHLLKHPHITEQERSAMIKSIDALTKERAKQALEKLNATIDERESAMSFGEPDKWAGQNSI